MEGMSERAYAEHAGLSRGAVQKARKTGRLVLFADGSINAAASDARRSSMTDPDQQIRSRGGLGAGGESPTMAPSAVSGPGDSTSYIKARTALTVYQAQESQRKQAGSASRLTRRRRSARARPRRPCASLSCSGPPQRQMRATSSRPHLRPSCQNPRKVRLWRPQRRLLRRAPGAEPLFLISAPPT